MPDSDALPRRALAAMAAGALLLPGCSLPGARSGGDAEVSAVEDLMREHGVLRRALVVYDRLADRLGAGDARFDARALGETAQLFRDFGEDYHERMLEEAFIFPRVRKAGGSAAAAADILGRQHDRGREITDYILAACRDGVIGSGIAAPLGRALRGMVVMYQAHAANEDTVVFPAWRAAISPAAYKDIGEQFEAIEKKVFGQDGFEAANARMAKLEQRLGCGDLSTFTAPAA